MPEDKSPGLTIHNVVIYHTTDELPEIGSYSDTGFVVDNLYGTKDPDLEAARVYAAKMTASHFGVNLSSATSEYEIIVVPFVDVYNDNGRILARPNAH